MTTGYSQKEDITIWNARHYGMASGGVKDGSPGSVNIRSLHPSKRRSLRNMAYSVEVRVFSVKTLYRTVTVQKQFWRKFNVQQATARYEISELSWCIKSNCAPLKSSTMISFCPSYPSHHLLLPVSRFTYLASDVISCAKLVFPVPLGPCLHVTSAFCSQYFIYFSAARIAW